MQIVDNTDVPVSKPERVSPVPINADQLMPRTRNSILKKLCAEAERLGANCAIWTNLGKHGNVIPIDYMELDVLRLIEQDAIMLGYATKKCLPLIQGAYLAGLLKAITSVVDMG